MAAATGYVRRSRVTSTFEGTIKMQACVAWAGAAAEYKSQSIQCRAFVCFFDLLLTTAPPNMCGGEPAPPASQHLSPYK